jgi:hypothetical protein
MRISPHRIPVAMARDRGHFGDIPTHFKQPADAIVSKVMEVQIINTEKKTRSGE